MFFLDKCKKIALPFPLIIGLSKDEKFVSSDVSAVLEYTRNILYLEDGEIISLTDKEYTIKEVLSDKIISKDIHRIEMSLDKIEKSGFKHFMLKEIYEQPTSLLASVRGRISLENYELHLGGLSDWIQHIQDADIIYITACGTSWHSALIGSYMLEEVLNVPVKVEYASELRYRDVPINSKSAVIAVSQSGETADTLAAIKKCKSLGAITVGIVNVVGSSIAREADCGLYIHAGPEIGVASTKAFTSQVAVLTLLTLFLKNKFSGKYTEQNKVISSFNELPKQAESILEQSDIIILVVDIRNPLLHISTSLINEIINNHKKKILVVLTKVDLVTKIYITNWVQYLKRLFPEIEDFLPFSKNPLDIELTGGIASRKKKLKKRPKKNDTKSQTMIDNILKVCTKGYVLNKIICVPVEMTSSIKADLIVPWVPTGINVGVSIMPPCINI